VRTEEELTMLCSDDDDISEQPEVEYDKRCVTTNNK